MRGVSEYSSLPPANEVYEDYVFTSFCHSVHRGRGSASRRGLHLGGVWQTPPRPTDTTGYGQQAGGTHPTGIHSCYRPQRSCEGYVFTGFCLSTGGRGWCLLRGGASQHALRQTPPGETATAADGTHPTGMHSCIVIFPRYPPGRASLYNLDS